MTSHEPRAEGALCPTCGEGRYDEDGFCSDAFHVAPWTEACGCVRKPGRWGSHLVTACKEHENLLRKPTDHREAPAPTLGERDNEGNAIWLEGIAAALRMERSPDDLLAGPEAAKALVDIAAQLRTLAERAEPDGAMREEQIGKAWMDGYLHRANQKYPSGYVWQVWERNRERVLKWLASAPQRAGEP